MELEIVISIVANIGMKRSFDWSLFAFDNLQVLQSNNDFWLHEKATSINKLWAANETSEI